MDLISSITQRMADLGVNSEEMFTRLDLDRNGLLARSELYEGLASEKVNIQTEEVNIVW